MNHDFHPTPASPAAVSYGTALARRRGPVRALAFARAIATPAVANAALGLCAAPCMRALAEHGAMPAFLVGVAVVVVAAVLHNRALRDTGSAKSSAKSLELDDYDAAYLADGAERVVAVAVAALEKAGALADANSAVDIFDASSPLLRAPVVR